MQGANQKKVKRVWTDDEIEQECKNFDQKIEEAKKTEGDTEIRDLITDKAKFLKNDAMDYPAAEKVFREAYEKTGGASRKMEILFEILFMNLEKLDIESVKKDIGTCRLLVTDGADWDKKNKLKIFEGAYFMMIRDFASAAKNFMSSTATFTCTELMEYKDFAFYTVVTSVMTQDRKTLRKEIIHSPDILAVIREIPYLRQFSDSLFYCDYRSFFEAFVEIIDRMKKDHYLDQHVHFFAKEMRLVAYKQFLESYKSVTIENMAAAFGVGSEFLDKELSAFIYQGRVNCKIDKVSGIIESNRPNKKVEAFQGCVK